ncbi:hypothetical protein ACN42_g8616 [Penicillium freii]|uniref:Uncharacterized protein n=1 Tax=Penicillium freii TaxID=48697 RepID=A0A101MDL1_PENFR|nr:hypothetical protein ACN42_g8616 [Penicillium freii]
MPGIDAKVQTGVQAHRVDLTTLASWISLFLHFETMSLYEYIYFSCDLESHASLHVYIAQSYYFNRI